MYMATSLDFVQVQFRKPSTIHVFDAKRSAVLVSKHMMFPMSNLDGGEGGLEVAVNIFHHTVC